MMKKRNVLEIFLILFVILMITPKGIGDDIPGIHLLIGMAVHSDDNSHANGALVTALNQRTGEELYDIVGISGNSKASGWYMINLSGFPSGFEFGDNNTELRCSQRESSQFVRIEGCKIHCWILGQQISSPKLHRHRCSPQSLQLN